MGVWDTSMRTLQVSLALPDWNRALAKNQSLQCRFHVESILKVVDSGCSHVVDVFTNLLFHLFESMVSQWWKPTQEIYWHDTTIGSTPSQVTFAENCPKKISGFCNLVCLLNLDCFDLRISEVLALFGFHLKFHIDERHIRIDFVDQFPKSQVCWIIFIHFPILQAPTC